jgi:nucleoside-diphosphate-sugar epimerase
MRILITGGTGFIGSRLLERLSEMGGHELYSLQRYVTGRYVLGANLRVKTLFCDLRDSFAVRCVIRELQPEVVFHLTAVSAISFSYDHPNEVLDTNLTGTVNLAEACLRDVPHFKQFLFASTSETYGNSEGPRREDTPQIPNSPYSVSKQAAEKYVLYMYDAYKFPATVLRPFNTYGRRDNTHFLVERMLVQMLRGDLVKLGDPTPERDLLYVDDRVEAYLSCLNHPNAIGQAFNFATGELITVRALAEKMREITGFKGQVQWDTIPRRPLDIHILYGDSTKVKNILEWSPKVTLDVGLRRTAEFWQGKMSVEKSRALHTAQQSEASQQA